VLPDRDLSRVVEDDKPTLHAQPLVPQQQIEGGFMIVGVIMPPSGLTVAVLILDLVLPSLVQSEPLLCYRHIGSDRPCGDHIAPLIKALEVIQRLE